MKKTAIIPAVLLTAVLGCEICSASIIPAHGPGQIGYSSVVLCESLSLHDHPLVDSEVTQTLVYGDRIIVMRQENGWAEVVLGDSEDSPSGWVDAGFLAVDPAWYHMDEDTNVYAWNDTSAPKVALMDTGTELPVLKEEGEWVLVSLRGAAGWIKNSGQTESQSASTTKAGTTEKTTVTTTQTAVSNGSSQEETQNSWFTVYAEDGSTESIRLAEGAMYEDADGRTYSKQEEDAFFYCINTDITYALDPAMWTGEAYGENEFPDEAEESGEAYGENEFPGETEESGEAYGENEFPDEAEG